MNALGLSSVVIAVVVAVVGVVDGIDVRNLSGM